MLKREANVEANDFFAASYASPCGDWGLTREISRGFTCCENGVLASSYVIMTNYMCIHLLELWYFGAFVWFCLKNRSDFSRGANYRSKIRGESSSKANYHSKNRADQNNRCHENAGKFRQNIVLSEISSESQEFRRNSFALLMHNTVHVNCATFHRACFLIPDYDGVYMPQ